MTRFLFAPTARSITTLDPKVYILLQRGTHQKQKTKEMACLALSLLQVPRASGRSGVTRRLDMTQTFLRLDLPWTNSYEPFQCPRASLVEKSESLMTFQKNGCVGGSVMTRPHSGSVSPQHFHTVHLRRSTPQYSRTPLLPTKGKSRRGAVASWRKTPSLSPPLSSSLPSSCEIYSGGGADPSIHSNPPRALERGKCSVCRLHPCPTCV
ncbi:uncharacterized protein K489DRAFT_185847 [Dissoconium aciculare CBS 342.82]|uniref:Uncharacterized protein n=1 Tax=Dissoconium aciculare CBS 342.82 TaxID=1314786 RepID=A0A6J3MAE5_9PEZI|nr:uncharacterized protein K489DRAFT_185847 [Dissoconium aciculare CBS 342.82]KAF1824604.1 hypothetical protein K489DRAFT_185847 [Dissoconium aciculare CBS 342.82]